MDKRWIDKPKNNQEYKDGVNYFMEYALRNDNASPQIYCPCKSCLNNKLLHRDIVREHLFVIGFSRGYTVWHLHGESTVSITSTAHEQTSFVSEPLDNFGLDNMMEDLYAGFEERIEDDMSLDPETSKFLKNIEVLKKPLFEGAQISKLTWLILSFHTKCVNGCTDKSYNETLELQKLTNPTADIPSSFYEVKKIIGELGFSYEKIDVCPNDCMIYMTAEDKTLNSCRICMTSRWKTRGIEPIGESSNSISSTKISAKVLRYFPVKQRLRRLFLSSKTAENMTWHANGRTKDGVLRHPADGEEWKLFDELNPDFADEPRNVRLGLSADGLEPFKHGNSHSIWPVTLVVYNLPPWMSMKQSYTQMPLLLSGPTSPSNNIDVFLRPLIDELLDLWHNGIVVYDAHKKERFTLRAVLLWTINDFPAYAMLSGWSTKGYFACPICKEQTQCTKLYKCKKYCYTGHRRWLDANHPYRRKAKQFDGTIETRQAPPEPSGIKDFNDVQHLNVVFGKKTKDTIPKEGNWRKNSIFNELPYWKLLSIRHNLDVMHIEKNVCELLISTLLNIKKQSKDTYEVRKALKHMKLRPELHPFVKPNGGIGMPPAKYVFSAPEKIKFLNVFLDTKFPDGHASSISNCVNLKEKKFVGLKSHDCHVIMQQLLPIAIRVLDDNDIVAVITDLCFYFRELCSKEFTAEDFKVLEKKIVPILCRMEMLFPPSIFTVMLHLTIHLPRESRLGGPVTYRYMYPFERMMRKLKVYIRNKSRPEGSIAEGFVADECITFCSMYMDKVETVFNRLGRNEGIEVPEREGLDVFNECGEIIGTSKIETLLPTDLQSIHRYILFNCDEIDRFQGIWKKEYRPPRGQTLPRQVDNALRRQFPMWFKDFVRRTGGEGIDFITDDIKLLASMPEPIVRESPGFKVNGYRFHTEERCSHLRFQNCGVYVPSQTKGYSSGSDLNPTETVVDYYGVLQKIIIVRYGPQKIVIFKCKWYDTLNRNQGYKIENGLFLLNSSKLKFGDDPYILATQARQCFYVADPRDSQWHAAVNTNPRDQYYTTGDSDEVNVVNCPSSSVLPTTELQTDVDNLNLLRTDIEPEVLMISKKRSRSTAQLEEDELNDENE